MMKDAVREKSSIMVMVQTSRILEWTKLLFKIRSLFWYDLLYSLIIKEYCY